MVEENIARANGKDMAISTKQSIEICNYIRGDRLANAKRKLLDAINEKIAVPFKIFTKDMGHKRNIAAGKYPRNACTNILKIIESAEANAKNIGLDTNNLVIKNIIANKAARPYRYGRRRRIKMKRTHIEVILSEAKK